MNTIFKDYVIRADTYSLTLKPGKNPKDKELLTDLYSDLTNRLAGIEDKLKTCDVEQMNIIINRKGVSNEE